MKILWTVLLVMFSFSVVANDSQKPPHAALIIKDGTINIFNESGKRVICNGFVKPGSYSKNIVLYCVDGGRGFCNKTFSIFSPATKVK